ncbi:MAG: hypothetical protein IE881_08060 [Epsilonproteobacteria bacterium]|nr:hypothetical protein [Campylobacterota bacterium]
MNFKILDPACGSGAFLNQALEFLIREHQELDLWRKIYEDEFLSLYDIETSVLENNLYGVDKGRVLTNLSEKIKCANSLLNMPFEKNYFDVVYSF